jgi:hypothetical protein
MAVRDNVKCPEKWEITSRFGAFLYLSIAKTQKVCYNPYITTKGEREYEEDDL